MNRPTAARKAGVTARFESRDGANRATRALQKELKLRTEDVNVALAPGLDAAELQGKGGYIGLTKAGAVLVHARVADPELMERVRDLFGRLGGTLLEHESISVSVGGYGPTTANGTRGVFGGAPNTSAMANHLYTQAGEPEKPAE